MKTAEIVLILGVGYLLYKAYGPMNPSPPIPPDQQGINGGTVQASLKSLKRGRREFLGHDRCGNSIYKTYYGY